jgi:hypothetical protein
VIAVREFVMRRIGVIIVVFGLLCAETTDAQRPSIPLTEAERAVRAEKGGFLRAAGLHDE